MASAYCKSPTHGHRLRPSPAGDAVLRPAIRLCRQGQRESAQTMPPLTPLDRHPSRPRRIPLPYILKPLHNYPWRDMGYR